MKIRLFTIPNLLTLSNLLCGAVGIVAALRFENLTLAFALMIAAAVFDFFDGFVARLLHQSSPIGLQLDSLADDISFGLLPTAILYILFGKMGWGWIAPGEVVATLLGLTVFCVTLCATLRLAKFNIDDSQRTEFCGLPSPAAALFCGSLGLLHEVNGLVIPREVLAGISLVVAWLMICDLRMFALKFHGFGWRGNEIRYTFLAVSLAMIVVLRAYAIPAIIALYVAVSILEAVRRRVTKEA